MKDNATEEYKLVERLKVKYLIVINVASGLIQSVWHCLEKYGNC